MFELMMSLLFVGGFVSGLLLCSALLYAACPAMRESIRADWE